MTVTDGDREKAREIVGALADRDIYLNYDLTVEVFADALAEEREKARAPFLALADKYDRMHDETWRHVREAISYDFDMIAIQIRNAAKETLP